MCSGLLRVMESFSNQASWNNPDRYWISILTLVNWVNELSFRLCQHNGVSVKCRLSACREKYPGTGRLTPEHGSRRFYVIVNVDQIKITPPSDDHNIVSNDERLRRAAATLEMVICHHPIPDGAAVSDFCDLDTIEVNRVVSDLRHSPHRVRKVP